jgi:hypothetical protein
MSRFNYLLRADVRDLGKILISRATYMFGGNQVRLPPMALDPQFSVMIATSQDDFEGAFKLFHEDAVTKKLTKPQPSGLKLSVHAVMPQNLTLIVR